MPISNARLVADHMGTTTSNNMRTKTYFRIDNIFVCKITTFLRTFCYFLRTFLIFVIVQVGETMQSRQMIEISHKALLDGDTPRLIDEWQALPPILDSIRSEVDSRGEPSQFILTGSSVLPEANTLIHSGKDASAT